MLKEREKTSNHGVACDENPARSNYRCIEIQTISSLFM